MLDELFTFPIIMIDGENEERKYRDRQKFSELTNSSDEDEQDYDMVLGQASYPYFDFIGLEDRWIPGTESLERAMQGDFEACAVRFLHAGQLLVPWTKEKFKDEIRKFAENYDLLHPQKSGKVPEVKVITITPDQFKDMTEDGD